MITNQTPSKVRRMLTPELSILYRPNDLQWSYSHHAAICKYKNSFYAIWSNGRKDEDDLGQRVLYAASKDGINWSKHHVLFDSDPVKVITAGGLYDNGEALVAYAGSYGYDPENVLNGKYITINDLHRDTTTLAKTSVDGLNWSDAIDLKIPVTPNHGPKKSSSGRLIIAGGVTFPYSDDPQGISGWTVSGLPPCPWEDMVDDSQGIMRHIALRNDGVFLCEGSFFQTDDGILHMLLRSDQRKLYETISKDDGKNWLPPTSTSFVSSGSKFHCGRLPDGRFYIVGNPDPTGARCPLVISLSEDGQVFDQEFIIDETFRSMRKAGNHKGGIYGYPHSIISDGKLLVICSINKEDIHVYSVGLDQFIR